MVFSVKYRDSAVHQKLDEHRKEIEAPLRYLDSTHDVYVVDPTSSQEMQKAVTQAETTVSAHERSCSI